MAGSAGPSRFGGMTTGRPFLATIDHRVSDGQVTVEVTLGLDESHVVGRAEGPADPPHLARLVGEATLRAVEVLTEGRVRLDLTAVGTSELGPVTVALAQVKERGWSDYLVGSALLRDGDAAAATAKAVLDALNRRLARLS